MTSRSRKTCSPLVGLTALACLLPVLLAGPVGADPGEGPGKGHASAPRHSPPGLNMQTTAIEAHPTHLLVRFKPHLTRAAEQAVHQRAGANRELRRYRLVDGLRLVEVAEGQRGAAMAAYAAAPEVMYVELDRVVHIAALPDDPDFSLQWGLRNTGQPVIDLFGQPDVGMPGADIRAEGAWDLTTGNPTMRVAVVDTGVDYTHPDLAANMWTNEAELNGIPDFDDDGNGYDDDIHGYDFRYDDGDPMDEHGHGTHVAGIIGAVGNNGIGGTGVNWHCQIVAVRFLDASGSGLMSGAIAAFDYLRNTGIVLSNHSWGIDRVFDQGLYDAAASLQANGHLMVAAAGNYYGRNIDVYPMYPASFDLPNIIAVASVTYDDVLSLFSNIGPLSVDIAAPGENVWSTFPGESYAYLSGTSMATPYVTGTAALLWGRRGELDWSEVRDHILRSARPVPSLLGRTVTGGIIDASVAVGDCNHNGVPDEDELASGASTDCNSDGFPDECETDCNGNGAPDECDLASGASADCNGNAVPDECDLVSGSSRDCNGNAAPDECDLLSGMSEDVNGTDVPDECESCVVVADCDDGNACTAGDCTGGLCYWSDQAGPCDDGEACTTSDFCDSGVCIGDPSSDPVCWPTLSFAAVAINDEPILAGPLSEVTVTQGDRLTVELFVRNWSPRTISAYNVTVDPGGYTSGSTGALSPVVDPTPEAGCFVDDNRPEFIFHHLTGIAFVSTASPWYEWAALVSLSSDCVVDEGVSRYLGTLLLDVGETASGNFELCFNEVSPATTFLECSAAPFPGITFECLTITVVADECAPTVDCNGNGSWDICDINDGTSEDCDGNDIPDECEPYEDCNGNAVRDSCDIAYGSSQDCDGNAIPDECDIAVCGTGDLDCDDCNENGVPDACDIASGFSQDCNGTAIPDECDIATCGGGDSDCDDCNGNGVPDACDIAAGTSGDYDEDGIPNDCECTIIDVPSPESQGACFDEFDCDTGVPCIDGVCYAEKGRYISFEPNNAGELVAFFVGDPPQLGTCFGSGAPCESSADCSKRCSISGSPCIKSCPPGAGFCMSPGCVGASPGSGQWVGEPDGLDTALLVDEPVYRVWTEPVIHVGDCAIVPSSSYSVRAMHQGCDPADGTYYSPAVTLTTALWGDIVGSFNVTEWTPPNGVINVLDLQAILQAESAAPTAPPMTWADLVGEVPNRVIDVNDTFWQSQAAQGNPYPFSDAGQCP